MARLASWSDGLIVAHTSALAWREQPSNLTTGRQNCQQQSTSCHNQWYDAEMAGSMRAPAGIRADWTMPCVPPLPARAASRLGWPGEVNKKADEKALIGLPVLVAVGDDQFRPPGDRPGLGAGKMERGERIGGEQQHTIVG